MKKLFALLGLSLLALNSAPLLANDAVNIYSARKEHLIRPILEKFKENTGISYNLLTADADQLLERLKHEGAETKADVFLTIDAGWLYRAREAGLLRSYNSTALLGIPANYSDTDHMWHGLSLRARVIFYAKERVKPEEIASYEDLAKPQWKGRLCMRSSNNIYNQSLLAALISHLGEEKAEKWAKGVVENLARKPQGGDTDQIKAIAAGECDLSIGNTYYYAGALTSSDEKLKATTLKVGVIWPDQKGRGVHVNVSGAGVVKASKQPEKAAKLIEFLAGKEAQKLYAELNHEFPVIAGVEIPLVLKELGEFKADNLKMDQLGKNNAAAVRIFDRAGWR